MRWKRIGRIFEPFAASAWTASHTSVPFADNLYGDYYRVYFSPRDRANRSVIAWFVIDITEPQTILDVAKQPILGPGEVGAFDDSGAMVTWITQRGDEKYLYYIGWNLGTTVPFRNSIGIAISRDGGLTFERLGEGPVVERTLFEPHFSASCSVLYDKSTWQMWYLSCVRWTQEVGGLRHWYHIKHATSDDGITWLRNNRVAIDFSYPGEYAISRPSVIRDPDLYRMWYSHRGDAYRIGYAESENGEDWVRKDTICGLDASGSGWDSEMVEYPHVFDHKGTRYMLYNGNGYGKTGIGLSVLD